MQISLLVANLLTILAFFLHTFVGDKELKILEPNHEADPGYQKREKWTMGRCGWHWVSVDLLLASIGLGCINFADILDNEAQLLKILALYFFVYGLVWLVGIAISQRFPKNYIKLGQWGLLWIISLLIIVGLN